MRKLLWVGDAGCPSGFARATHETLASLDYRLGGAFDCTVLGINYRGDPHLHPYPIYAAAVTGDAFGLKRLIWMCDLVKPDVIVLQNDPWNVPGYLQQLLQFSEYAKVPVIGSIAVDGKNCAGNLLNGLALAVFWTWFGLNEARAGGYEGLATVVPLGVDLNVYRPIGKSVARVKLPEMMHDKFIVGNINRNQPRKRWDLTIKYFASWVKSKDVDDAYLYLHTAPTGDTGVHVTNLARYYGVLDRLILVTPPVWYGIPEEELAQTYNCFDVGISTTQGEGFGLTTIEAMACGIPCIVPAWAALGDWARDATYQVSCTSTAIGPPYVNVIGGVPDEAQFVEALDALYQDVGLRVTYGARGCQLTGEPRFRWANIGRAFGEAVEQVLDPPAIEEEWQDLGRLMEATT